MMIFDQIKGKKWIVAVSGGSDSMALLGKSIQYGLDTFVVHINYQKRKSAKRDEDLVRSFCERKGIPYAIILFEEEYHGNFQAVARAFRYRIFQEYVELQQAEGVLVAHQLDDVIETYIMQKNRNAIPYVYGMKQEIVLKGLRIVRPLLSYEKKDLIAYCKKEEIPFAIDESNLEDVYTRNQVRHDIVEHMTCDKKHQMMKMIQYENRVLVDRRRKAMKFISHWDKDAVSLCKEKDASFILYLWIYKETKQRLTHKQLGQLVEWLGESKGNFTQDIGTQYHLNYEYGYLYIVAKNEEVYTYVISELEEMETPYFKLKHTGTTIQSVAVTKEDFPLTIRNVHQGDYIQLRYGKKRLNRFFIDRKIPKMERLIWPVMVNAKGQVIFVPKIGCDVEHYSINPSIFMVK